MVGRLGGRLEEQEDEPLLAQIRGIRATRDDQRLVGRNADAQGLPAGRPDLRRRERAGSIACPEHDRALPVVADQPILVDPRPGDAAAPSAEKERGGGTDRSVDWI